MLAVLQNRPHGKAIAATAIALILAAGLLLLAGYRIDQGLD